MSVSTPIQNAINKEIDILMKGAASGILTQVQLEACFAKLQLCATAMMADSLILVNAQLIESNKKLDTLVMAALTKGKE